MLNMLFDCTWRHTAVQLKLLHDYDMLSFCLPGVRECITQPVKWYAKPDNKVTPANLNKKLMANTWIACGFTCYKSVS